MLYAFKLGPIHTDDGEMTGVFAMTPERALEPRFGRAPTALREFAKLAAGDELLCEPALAKVGKPFGFVAADAPEWAAEPRAILAFGLALGNAAPPPSSPIVDFLDATSAFVHAAPWRYWDNGHVIDVRITRDSKTLEYEGCIMGAGGLEFGLALYPEKGSIARLNRVRSPRDARNVESIAVTMDDEPAWAIDALEEAFGLDGIPVPIRIAKGRPGPARSDDLATLAIALRAIADLRPTRRENEISFADDAQPRCAITARVRAPEPARFG